MLVSYTWLKEYVDVSNVSPKELAELLTKHGVAVEYVHSKENDSILELDLTPNRSDCLSMIGVAYEVAAILEKEVTLPDTSLPESVISDKNLSLVNEVPTLVPYYGAAIIENITVGESPTWLKESLEHAGIRSVNNVVDVTNYVMLEYGQPLHAYDYETLTTKQLSIRLAKSGESITTLDDTKRTLSSNDLVICDGDLPIAIAGVMGGKETEINQHTTNLVLEYAAFDAISVRQTAKSTHIRSEASLRYEKGIDVSSVHSAGMRAIDLLLEVTNGYLVSLEEKNNVQTETKTITTSLEYISKMVGFVLYEEEIETIFDRLQFSYQQHSSSYTVTIPERRNDLVIEADLLEEIVRLYGYDQLPSTLPVSSASKGGLSIYQQKRRKVKQTLSTIGFHQAITYSLTNKEKTTENALSLSLPMSEEKSTMRSSLLPHLLDVSLYNKNRKEENIALYEVGNVFTQEKEHEKISGIMSGYWYTNNWQREKKKVDFFVVKGIVDVLLQTLHLTNITYQKTTLPNMHPGRTASVYHNNKVIGTIGQIHPSLAEETYVFELDAKSLYEHQRNSGYELVSKYPTVSRDITIEISYETPSYTLVESVQALNQSLVKDVKVIDVYVPNSSNPLTKSVTLSLTYQNKEETLKDEDIASIHDLIAETLKKEVVN